MNNARLRAVEEGLTGIARKVLEAVPCQEQWTLTQIATEMRRLTGSSPEMRVVQGCLKSLRESGLVKETGMGFQRIMNKEPETVTHLKLPDRLPPEPPQSPEDKLAGVAFRLRGLAQTCLEIAKDIDDATLELVTKAEGPNEELEKLRQLKTLLKGL